MAQASTHVLRNPLSRPYTSFANFFAENGVKIQRFSIDPSRQTIIVGQHGTRFTFYPFSLVDTQGNIIKETAEIQLKEVFFKNEMVLSNKVTTSEDRLLESSGQFWIQAFRNGLPLKLKTNLKVELPVRKKLSNPLGMKLFEGSIAITRTFSSNTAFDWKLVSDKSVAIVKIGAQKYFNFQIKNFNWINCDAFYAKKASKTMVSVRLEEDFDEFQDLAAFLVFKDANALCRMYSNGNRFTSFNIPAKKAATILVMGIKNGALYANSTRLNTKNSRLLNLDLKPVEEAQLFDLLKTL